MHRYLLVRHATASSAGPGAELTVQGRLEAEALGRRLVGWRLDDAWSSYLPRAAQTAGIVLSGRDFPRLQQSEALREVEVPEHNISPDIDPIRYAAWEREVVEGMAERLSGWLRDGSQASGCGPHPDPLPKGEGTGEHALALVGGNHPLPLGEAWTCQRACPRGEGLNETIPPTTLVVSHAGPLRVLICLLLGLSPAGHWSFRLDPASLTMVERGGDLGTLTLLNDRCHLIGEGAQTGDPYAG